MTPMEKLAQLEKKIDALKNTIHTLVSGIDTISEQIDLFGKVLQRYHDAVLNVPPDVPIVTVDKGETDDGWPSS